MSAGSLKLSINGSTQNQSMQPQSTGSVNSNGPMSLNVSRSLTSTLAAMNLHNGQPTSSPSTPIVLNGTDPGRYVRTERSVNDYKTLTDVDHVYQIPDTYIGSIDPNPRTEWLLDLENYRLVQSQISISHGMERLYLEVLSNAGDNTDFSRRANVDPGRIDVKMDRQWIVIRNGGVPIPVDHPEGSPTEWVPSIIFGKLRSSSNYDPKVIRLGCGRNGFGAKLANIFSKVFIVKVGDPQRQRLYTGTWRNNMKEGPEVTIEPYMAESFVEISWAVDFARFNMTEYPNESFGLFARYVADFSLTCKVPVSFNGKQMDYRNIREYCRLYWTDEICKTAIIHYEWPSNMVPEAIQKASGLHREKIIAAAAQSDHIAIIELCILDTPDAAVCLSYVNGLMTIDGGVHVKEAFKAISQHLLEDINASFEKSAGSGKKGKKASASVENVKTPHLTVSDIQPHISMVLNCRLPDPRYNSQSKTVLASPKPSITISEQMTKVLEKWHLVTRLFAALEAKMFKTLTKTDGKKKKHVFLDKGQDANDAGTNMSSQCVLYLVEGQSASAYPKKRIVMTPGGRDRGGYYPLKGKFPNVTKFSIMRLAGNSEIIAIKKMGGLVEGTDYKNPQYKGTLRYGLFLITADSDSDGKHITTLLINYIHMYFPSLLAMGMIAYLRTPVVRVISNKTGKSVKVFFSTAEYEKWEATAPASEKSGTKTKYYKGLGTSRDSDISEDLGIAPIVVCVYDDLAPENLRLAFDPDFADARKDWIAKWRDVTQLDDVVIVPLSQTDEYRLYKKQNLSDFINRELIDYTKEALFRAIPSMYSGLKDSQTKAMYSALIYWNYGRSSKSEMKVGRFGNKAAEMTNYHHGEKSMSDTIIKMAQSFVGSNNLPYFTQDGQFGTRTDGGSDAAEARYSETRLEWWIKYAYDEETIGIVPKRIVEGEEVEPQWLPCVIPMHLVNGALGVATGHSTFIPMHNPYDIIRWLIEKCSGVSNPQPILPWYRGFKGKIIVKHYDYTALTENGFPIIGSPPRTPVPVNEDDVEEDQLLPAEINPETPVTDPDADPQSEEAAQFIAEYEATRARSKGPSMITVGLFHVTGVDSHGRSNLMITELPIGRWTSNYEKWLDTLIIQKKIVDYRATGTTETVNIEITGFSHPKGPNAETLCLQRSYGLGNITLIDSSGKPYRFKDPQHVLETFYLAMIGLYGELKKKRIKDVEDQILDLGYRAKFITLVCRGQLIIINRPEADIVGDMDRHSIPSVYLDKIKARGFTMEAAQKAERDLQQAQVELAGLHKLTPQSIWIEKLTALQQALRSHNYS